ncbi:MAG: indolepyruvate oxidoreductase subunit beta [Candidatus Nealsonbacteria bacterium]
MTQKLNQFNIVVVGTGGQGLITLLQVMAEAAVFSGFDLKTSELHGLSQRGGSVEVHIRFGKKIYSPLVAQGEADLVIALETQESLRAAYFANKKTIFLINKYIVPVPLQTSFTEDQVSKILSKIAIKIEFVPAAERCQKEIGTQVVAGTYLVALAAFKGFLPLKTDLVLKAIKKVIPEKYFEVNKKAFDLAEYDGKKQ